MLLPEESPARQHRPVVGVDPDHEVWTPPSVCKMPTPRERPLCLGSWWEVVQGKGVSTIPVALARNVAISPRVTGWSGQKRNG